MKYVEYADLETAGVLTVEEAAHVLRIGRTTAYDKIASGEIKTLPFTRPVRISARWLKAFIDGEVVTGPQALPDLEAIS
jgi:excisionase family DNA binding protein